MLVPRLSIPMTPQIGFQDENVFFYVGVGLGNKEMPLFICCHLNGIIITCSYSLFSKILLSKQRIPRKLELIQFLLMYT